jgi:ABC-type transporter Mla MlaB component
MGERFELPAELNIYGAIDTRDALLAWVTEHSAKTPDTLEISAKDVAEIDGSGLQLLASLSNMEQSWHLVEASEVFIEACRTMGLEQWLDKRYLKNLEERTA